MVIKISEIDQFDGIGIFIFCDNRLFPFLFSKSEYFQGWCNLDLKNTHGVEIT